MLILQAKCVVLRGMSGWIGENYSDDRSIILIILVTKKGREKSAATDVYYLIENKNINNTIIASLVFLYNQKNYKEK